MEKGLMMTTLINMEQSAEEAKEYTNTTPADAPKFPWGLCITLNDDSLEKLGITALPSVDTVVAISARATVYSARETQTQGGDSEKSIDLQITDMRLDGLGVDDRDRTASLLYDKK